MPRPGHLLPSLALLTAPLPVIAAPAAWPADKESLAALATAPDNALAVALKAKSDDLFSKKNFADAVALRRLSRLVAFMAENTLPDGLRGWMGANREEAEEFALLLGEHDDEPRVAGILTRLWTGDEKGFRAQPRLALAIALVYDKPCPARFPHGQVAASALPRRLHDPAEAFAFFKESAEGGRLAQNPQKLGLDELAFVVPVLAPFKELREAQRNRITRADIPKLYPGITYDHSRLRNREYAWPGASYTLADIKARGGICVDQAYYTATTAQAFGVPAFILSGSGNDGFHAFVGFLERPGKWRMDVGRYPEQKYASGEAWNPLTWETLTDHDLAFLQERIRNTPAYAAVLLHVEKAREALAAGDTAAAEKLLGTARNTEPRCPEVWAALAELADKRGDAPEKRRTLYADAAKALSKYRELEVNWRERLADAYEKDGKPEKAFDERTVILRRSAKARPDLAVEQAREMLLKVLADRDSKDARKIVPVFNRLANQFDEAGPEFFTKLVYPFVHHLMKEGLKTEAKQVARSVSQRFKAGKGSQLEEMQKEITEWVAAGELRNSQFFKAGN